MSNEDQQPEATPAPLPSGDHGGFTSVAHPIFRYWMAILSGDDFQALCCIIDRTWGFQQQIAYISLSDFKRAMGIPPKHDVRVYRALHELFFFHLIAESSVTGKRNVKAYFVTLAALDTTNTVLVVKEGGLYITLNATSNPTLAELLTLREEIHLHPVSSSPNTVSVDKKRLFTRQAAHEVARAKAKRRAKDTSLKKDLKHTLKERAASLNASPPHLESEKGKEGKEDEETRTPPPAARTTRKAKDTPPPPLQPTKDTMENKSTTSTKEEVPARRLADRLAKEQQGARDKARAEQEAEQREVSQLQQAYDEAVRAKSQASPNSPEWEAARQRLNELKRQLAEHGWYL